MDVLYLSRARDLTDRVAFCEVGQSVGRGVIAITVDRDPGDFHVF